MMYHTLEYFKQVYPIDVFSIIHELHSIWIYCIFTSTIETTKSVIIAKREKTLFVYESTEPVKIRANSHVATI